jgi:hypothetical protein
MALQATPSPTLNNELLQCCSTRLDTKLVEVGPVLSLRGLNSITIHEYYLHWRHESLLLQSRWWRLFKLKNRDYHIGQLRRLHASSMSKISVALALSLADCPVAVALGLQSDHPWISVDGSRQMPSSTDDLQGVSRTDGWPPSVAKNWNFHPASIVCGEF